MKPAAFSYQAPRTVDDVLAQLAQHGADARILAGGQTLLRLMNSRAETPGVIIDINKVAGLDGLSVEDGTIRIGALVRQRTVETSPDVKALVPVLCEAGAEVAHVSIREHGTLVGSLAFADPSGELPTAFLALDGVAVVRSVRGERVIPAAELFLGPSRTAVAADEIIVEARIPALPSERTGSAFLEVTRRHGELPVCGVATVVRLADDGTVVEARIAVGGVGDRPQRASQAEASLVGRTPDDDAVRHAGDLAAAAVEPRPTIHGSAAYRRHLCAVVTRRSLARAAARALEGADHD